MKFKKILEQKSWQDLFLLTLVSIFFFLINTHNLDSWYYSAIGDEYAFFDSAKNISLGTTKLSILPGINRLSIFDQKGVYGIISITTSAYQALIMKIFGITHRGWLISSILIIIFSFWPIFCSVKEWFGRKSAAFSLLIFAFSHYLWAFSHTGFSAIQAIFPAVLTFFLFTKALKGNQFHWWFLSGLSSAFSFNIYYLPGITFPLIVLYLTINRKSLKLEQILYFFIGFLLFFIPYLMINYQVTLSVFLNRLLFTSGEIPHNRQVYYFFKNFWQSFSAYFRNSKVSLYTSGSLVDPISGFCYLFGLITILASWKRHYFFLVIWACLLILIGGLSKYIEAPISRLYFMLPIITLIAGLGLERIFNLLRKQFSQLFCSLTVIVIFLMILVLNINRFFFQTPRVLQSTGEAVAIKAFKEVCPTDKTAIIDKYPEPVLEPAISSYNFKNLPSLFNIDKTKITDLLQYTCFIIVRPYMPQLQAFSMEIEKYFPSFKKIVVKDYSEKTTVFVYRAE